LIKHRAATQSDLREAQLMAKVSSTKKVKMEAKTNVKAKSVFFAACNTEKQPPAHQQHQNKGIE